MRPILLVTIEYPPQRGGIATYLAHIAENLPHGNIIVLAPEMKSTHEYDMNAGVPIYRYKMLWKYMRPRWLLAFYWTWRMCRKDRPSMVMVSHLLNMGKVALGIKRVLGIPYGVILHGYDVAQAKSTTYGRRLAAREILGGASLVVCNSVYTGTWAQSLGVDESRIAYVNPPPWLPLDTKADAGEVAQFRKIHELDGKFTLLYVGRLVKRKGVDTCIKAVAKLRAEGCDVKYIVIGDGPDKGRLKKMAMDANVADHVVFTGMMNPNRLSIPYTACDAFVMVPRSLDGGNIEGYGIVYLEANIFGRPVIGSRTGGVPEAVIDGETGLLVEPGDVDGLVKTVRKLMNDESLRKKLGEGGRARLEKDYGDNRQARRFLAAVRRAIGVTKEYEE
ncbi:MAG: glycosyltransferase family 4 protein [Patescibacteria group bacterium]|nr:glycosyltransferase family 4 protein [Patescibacteria group bacterium]